MRKLEELKGEVLGVATAAGTLAVSLGALSAGSKQTVLAVCGTVLGTAITIIATIRHKTNTEAKAAAPVPPKAP